MDLILLKTISVILITAVVILLIFNKLKLPSMIGLFLTGVILGQFINSTEIITEIAELGGKPNTIVCQPCVHSFQIHDKSDFILLGCK